MTFSRRQINFALALAPVAWAGASLHSSVFAQDTSSSVSSVIQAANAYLKSLDANQKKLAQYPFTDERRIDWHFIPMETRKGLPLRDMSDDQGKLAIQFLKSLLSEKGFKRVTDIMSYEAILLKLEGPGAAKRRDYKKFYFTFYGEPSAQGQWGFSVEGHHVSLNFTFDRGVIVDSTPQFYGVNPAKALSSFTVPSVNPLGSEITFKEGYRLLGSEEDAGLALMSSLNDSQQAKAVFNSECPDDIQWAGEAQPTPSTPVGIPAVDLDVDQKKLLMNLIEVYQATMPKEVVLNRMNLITAAGLDAIHFGWAGTKNLSGQHFYRVQGPTFIAEFCNYQQDASGNVANHIHCVWRDMTGDFNLPVVASAK